MDKEPKHHNVYIFLSIVNISYLAKKLLTQKLEGYKHIGMHTPTHPHTHRHRQANI